MNNEQKAARDAATTRILEWMETRLCSKISCHQIAEEAVRRAFDSGYEYEPPDDPEFNELLGAAIEDINDKYRKEGFDAGYAARDAEDAWVAIRSEDDLPDEDGDYLVQYKFDGSDTGPFESTAEFFAEGEDPAGWLIHRTSNQDARVIAYMPIPKHQPTEGE